MTTTAPQHWIVPLDGLRHAIAAVEPETPYCVAVDPVAACCGRVLRFVGQAEVGEPTCSSWRSLVFPQGLRYAGALVHGLGGVERNEDLARSLAAAGQNIGSEAAMRKVLRDIAGSGTTVDAAARNRRRVTAAEIDPRWCAEIAERARAATAQGELAIERCNDVGT